MRVCVCVFEICYANTHNVARENGRVKMAR